MDFCTRKLRHREEALEGFNYRHMGCEYENTKRKQLNINRVTQQKKAL